MSLSVIIPCADEPEALMATVESIRATSTNVKIVIVDDLCSTPIKHYVPEAVDVKIVSNKYRIGVGPSRHVGVCAAETRFIMLVDSHMRFSPDWATRIVYRLKDSPKSILNPICVGLEFDKTDMNNTPGGEYHGATLTLLGDDPKTEKKKVFEPTWLTKKQEPKDDQKLAVCMGAAYCMSREWFLKIDALRHLRGWGSDEVMLSVKSYLMGGDVRFVKSVRVGHIFFASSRKDQPKKTFKVEAGLVLANKMFSILTLSNDLVLNSNLFSALSESEDALNWRLASDIIKRDWQLVASEIANNEHNFIHSFQDYLTTFGITMP